MPAEPHATHAQTPAAPNAATIGTFDGVHLGHAALVARARAHADATGGQVIALVFDPHPLTQLNPASAPARLTDFASRERLLKQAGADTVVRLEPSPELLALSPRAFIEQTAARHRVGLFVEGPDFRFGKARAGDGTMLSALGAELGFTVVIQPTVECALCDHTIVPASSSMVRWLVQHGRVPDAALVLGRPHELAGLVERGDQRGRTIGFPTANLRTDCLLPADGVYAAIAHLPDGRRLPAAVHVGPRATFAQPERVVEAHVIGWDGPLASDWPGAAEYGWSLRIGLIAHLRDPLKFEGIGPLVAQIQRDAQRAAQIVAPMLNLSAAAHRDISSAPSRASAAGALA